MSVETEKISRLAQEHGNVLAFVVNHFGGRDSTRMLGLVRKKFPYSPAYAVKADTEFDHKVPISAEDWARLRCAEFGLDLAVVRNSNELIADLEREMNFTMRPGASLVQIVEAYSSTQNEQARQQSLCF